MFKKALFLGAGFYLLSCAAAQAEFNVGVNIGAPVVVAPPVYTTPYPTYVYPYPAYYPYPTYYDPHHRWHDTGYWRERRAHEHHEAWHH